MMSETSALIYQVIQYLTAEVYKILNSFFKKTWQQDDVRNVGNYLPSYTTSYCRSVKNFKFFFLKNTWQQDDVRNVGTYLPSHTKSYCRSVHNFKLHIYHPEVSEA